MIFWVCLFVYFLGSKCAEYLLVAGHSIRAGKLERPVFTWSYWIACVLWPLWILYIWLGLILLKLTGKK